MVCCECQHEYEYELYGYCVLIRACKRCPYKEANVGSGFHPMTEVNVARMQAQLRGKF